MLKEIIDNKLLTGKAIFGIFPANTVNDDDIEVYDNVIPTDHSLGG